MQLLQVHHEAPYFGLAMFFYLLKFHAGSPGLTFHSLRLVLGLLVLPLFCKKHSRQLKGTLRQSGRHKSIDNSLTSLHLFASLLISHRAVRHVSSLFLFISGYHQNHQFHVVGPRLCLWFQLICKGSAQTVNCECPSHPPLYALSLCPWLVSAFSNQMPNHSERKRLFKPK